MTDLNGGESHSSVSSLGAAFGQEEIAEVSLFSKYLNKGPFPSAF